MELKKILKVAKELIEPYKVTDGKNFRLKDVKSSDTGKLVDEDKPRAKEALRLGIEALMQYQDMLYAQNRWSVLLIFQAMDAAGKDGTIKHVMSGINPQGCSVTSFKTPSSEELSHDYLWRSAVALPERGQIGIFNRSYYEETLVVKVHPEILAKQQLPQELITKNIWDERYKDIRNFEKYLSNNGTVTRKFFLHVSKEEQKRRFLERLDAPAKNWKFSEADLAEREHWDEYQEAYEETIRATATKECPWYVIPADNKWYTRMIVAAAVVDTLGSLDLHYPRVSAEKMQHFATAKEKLAKEK
jgi:PPK2 family polyphosphate:nucleotide phosphotransferase